MSEGKLGEKTSKPNGPKQLGMLIAKLSPAPASAGLRLALFPFDPATHPPTYRDSSFEPTKTTIAA